MDSVYDHLLAVLDEKFDVPGEDVRPEATLSRLGFDSISTVELFETLTAHYPGITLDETGEIAGQSIAELVQAVEAQLPAVAAREA
ncbi:acyl carrier protein [Streptomyces lavendulae]|uniref:acyl carrier protein n=1 Tax=Streptomyces lavendulae TaxID=1914 RepID=UPI0033DEF2D8